MVRLEFPHPDGREIEKNVEKNLKLRGLVSGWILSLCHYVNAKAHSEVPPKELHPVTSSKAP